MVIPIYLIFAQKTNKLERLREYAEHIKREHPLEDF